MKVMKDFKVIIKTKKGFTLTELIVSSVFVVLIIGAACYAWYAGNESFRSTNSTSIAYTQARTLETMIQTAASTTPSLKFRDTPLSNSGLIKYSHFYFDNSGSEPVYKVTFYGNDSVINPTTMEFPAIDEVTFSVKDLGRRYLLKYHIEVTDEEDRPFYIEAGVVLNNLDRTIIINQNPVYDPLPLVLNFQAPKDNLIL